MGFFSDLNILFHLVFKRGKGTSHKERLEDFYGGQANSYDNFRRRLLKGREELWQKLIPQEGQIWVDIGGGTGANIENISDENLRKLKKVYIVDLSESLLKVADERIKAKGWTNVETVCADATTWVPPEGKADIVTFSYSLTMIPDWFIALDHADSILAEDGTIGVVDFYLSRKYPADGHKRHGWLTRSFWPVWFGCDNVFPTCDHVPYLHYKYQQMDFEEQKGRIPLFPLFWWKMPYYIFTGKKKEQK